MGRSTQRIVFKKRIQTPWGELRMKERVGQTDKCQIHTWPTMGLARRLIEAMKERHPRGIDACTSCIERAKADADHVRDRAARRRSPL